MTGEKFCLFYTEKARFKHYPLHAVFLICRALTSWFFFVFKRKNAPVTVKEGQQDFFVYLHVPKSYWLAVWLTLRKALISGWCSTNLNLICYTFQRAELACTDRIETQMVARHSLCDVKRKRTTHLGYLNALYKTLAAILQLTSARYFTS